MHFCVISIIVLFFCVISCVDTAFSKEVPATPTGGGGRSCKQFELGTIFDSGTTIFQMQTRPAVNSVPIQSIMSVQFNCSSRFQVMCYAIGVAMSDFNVCIDQVGTVISDATTTPGSTPDQICAKFNFGAKLSQVGHMVSWYSNCP